MCVISRLVFQRVKGHGRVTHSGVVKKPQKPHNTNKIGKCVSHLHLLDNLPNSQQPPTPRPPPPPRSLSQHNNEPILMWSTRTSARHFNSSAAAAPLPGNSQAVVVRDFSLFFFPPLGLSSGGRKVNVTQPACDTPSRSPNQPERTS